MPHFVPVANFTKSSADGKMSFKLPKMPQSVSSAIVKVSAALKDSER